MRFTPQFLDEVRDRIPIADVVGRRVQFDRKKSNPAKGDFWGCCPFHGEKTPSFHCENAKGRYHCFGCGVSGDHFRFLTELDGMSFPEAVQRLADEAGVALPAPDPQAARREKERASLTDVMAMAAGFFRERLHSADGAAARAYLRDRGLSGEVQERFGLGYAPGSRSALKEFLAGKGVEKAQIEACGLVVHGPDVPVSYDRFRDRIMFPILDARERVIAFGGRALSPDVPAKYLNSPETELFSKSNVLYNYARARKAVGKGGALTVVEGYMDVIALNAAGVQNAVAPLGTALTDRQVELAWRVGGEPVLCFDGDGAGLRAAFRSIDTAMPKLAAGRSLRFALLPDGEDPDDLVKRGGRAAFDTVVTGARSLADMLWQRETTGRVVDTPERRAELERDLFGALKAIEDEDVRRHYQQDARERLDAFFGRGHRRDKGQAQGRGQRPRERGGRPGAFAVSQSLAGSALARSARPAVSLREATLLATLVNHPSVGFHHLDEAMALRFAAPAVAALHAAVCDQLAAMEDEEALEGIALRDLLARAGHGQALETVERPVRANRLWQALEGAAPEDARDGWGQTHRLHMRRGELDADLREAERGLAEGDEGALERLVAVQQAIAEETRVEAEIAGFGAASGRPQRRF